MLGNRPPREEPRRLLALGRDLDQLRALSGPGRSTSPARSPPADTARGACCDAPGAACEHQRVTVAELWRRGQVGWPRSFPIAQFPNPPLLFAFAGLGLAAATEDTTHDV